VASHRVVVCMRGSVDLASPFVWIFLLVFIFDRSALSCMFLLSYELMLEGRVGGV
jgi:hypothetical protein